MDIDVKSNAYGRVFLLVMLAIVLVVTFSLFYRGAPVLDQAASGRANVNRADGVSKQHSPSLIVESIDIPPVSISFIASSVRDGNAVIRQQGKARVISVGDELIDGGLKMKVAQVSDQQLILRPTDSNDIYLVAMSEDGTRSKVQKISSHISLSNAMIDGSPTPNKP